MGRYVCVKLSVLIVVSRQQSSDGHAVNGQTTSVAIDKDDEAPQDISSSQVDSGESLGRSHVSAEISSNQVESLRQGHMSADSCDEEHKPQSTAPSHDKADNDKVDCRLLLFCQCLSDYKSHMLGL